MPSASSHPRAGSAIASDTTFVLRPRFRTPFTMQRGLLPQKTLQRPKVGLVLSGGGPRGVRRSASCGHLERHGIPIDFIAATSMGVDRRRTVCRRLYRRRAGKPRRQHQLG
ncbi:MAG: hypothetical protein MZV64_31595 [Ignavibacteriales bacterium]|nr:hypothetical protein [Ignavibacteriales bacterium]